MCLSVCLQLEQSSDSLDDRPTPATQQGLNDGAKQSDLKEEVEQSKDDNEYESIAASAQGHGVDTDCSEVPPRDHEQLERHHDSVTAEYAVGREGKDGLEQIV